MGEHGVVLFPMFVLFGEVPRVVSAEALPAPLPGACNVGSSPGFANDSDQTAISNRSGGDRNDVDDPLGERRFVDS